MDSFMNQLALGSMMVSSLATMVYVILIYNRMK